MCPFGARGGSRTRTPLRALAPEASESTNSTTRASGLVASATEVIIPRKWASVNTFFQFLFIFCIGPLAQRLASGHASSPADFLTRKTKKKDTTWSCPSGARGGSRTRTPLRALAPEASESTNSTTRASGVSLVATRDILPWVSSFVNRYFQKNDDFFRLTKRDVCAIINKLELCGCAGTGRLASLRC